MRHNLSFLFDDSCFKRTWVISPLNINTQLNIPKVVRPSRSNQIQNVYTINTFTNDKRVSAASVTDVAYSTRCQCVQFRCTALHHVLTNCAKSSTKTKQHYRERSRSYENSPAHSYDGGKTHHCGAIDTASIQMSSRCRTAWLRCLGYTGVGPSSNKLQTHPKEWC